METVLTLSKVSKSFPGVKALQNVDWSLARGEIHALLGENGAGKSTLMKILSGIYQPDEGTITVEGKTQRFETYNDAIAAGIAIIFQEFSLIPDLNAVENMFLGRERRRAGGLLDKPAMKARAQQVFDELGIAIPLNVPVRALSVAQQQFVEIGKALSLDARILILDEPTATLTPNEAEHLFHIMRGLRAKGVAMAFITHHMEEIVEICDRVTVLRDGSYVGTVPVQGVDVDGLVEMMVGRRLDQTFPPKHQGTPGRMLIEVRELQEREGAPSNRFHLRAGEILGFAGLVGSGRSETAMALIGAAPVHRKEVLFDGRPARLRDPAEALATGIGILPESRKTQGLILDASVRRNISINNLHRWRRLRWLIDRRAERDETAEVSRRVRVKTPSVETAVGTLSGGNQQKVVIARWLTRQCRVLIFDEPTRGIDVGAKAEIYALMRDLTRQGYAVLMISSELPEVIGMCDRVCVFRQGAIVATLEADAIDSNEVMRHATGY